MRTGGRGGHNGEEASGAKHGKLGRVRAGGDRGGRRGGDTTSDLGICKGGESLRDLSDHCLGVHVCSCECV